MICRTQGLSHGDNFCQWAIPRGCGPAVLQSPHTLALLPGFPRHCHGIQLQIELMIREEIRLHVHHICTPTPHAHIPILSHNVTHRTLQAADPLTTAFAIAQGQMVELPRMQRHNKERTLGTHLAQARCTAGRRRNYRVFACVNAPICVPTLLSLAAQKGPFAHAKGRFCVLARKIVDAQNVQFEHAKGCICVPGVTCAGTHMAPFAYARMG